MRQPVERESQASVGAVEIPARAGVGSLAESRCGGMDVRVLGPLEASVDGRPLAIGAGKPRALLAMLALQAGSTVSTGRLIDGLWGERPPATAAKMLQQLVSQLRMALAASGGDAEVVTRGRGYELRLEHDDVDVRRFERLVAEGAPREALGLWRGPALDDLADEPFAAAEIRRLEELRLTAIELAIDGDLAAGRHRELIGELDALVAGEPLRERLRALQRLLALYRSGRQAEALAAYRVARAALVEQIDHGARGRSWRASTKPSSPTTRSSSSRVRLRSVAGPDADRRRDLPVERHRGVERSLGT